MDYIGNHLAEIIAVIGSIISAFLVLKHRLENLQHQHFEDRITKLIKDVEDLKKETVKTDYLKRIDEDIDSLRGMIQQTREEFVKKSDLKETECRIIDAFKDLEKRVSEGMSKKVDIVNCKLIHGKE